MKKLLLFVLLTYAGSLYSQVVANPPSPIILCDNDNPGDEIEIFDLTIREDEILNGQTGLTVSYHLTSGDALGNGGFIMNPDMYTNSSNPQQIYIRVQGSGNFDITTMDIEVVQYAMAEVLPETIFIDEGDGNGQAIFDLTENENAMLGGQFAVDFVFNYFLSAADCDAFVNPIVTPENYTNTMNPQDIYVRMEPYNAPCFTCYTFTVASDGVLDLNSTKLSDLKIYPNPAIDELHITSKDLLVAKILIRDVLGRIITSKQSDSNAKVINVSALEKGMYFLTIENKNFIETRGFLKK